jgi:hypothetical protein
MAGAALVVGSGLYMLWRERQLGRSTAGTAALEAPRE